MAKYVPDVKTQRWVIIASARSKRPDQSGDSHAEVPQGGAKVCPFCPGNEAQTPPELYRIGGGEKDKPGWQVRVIPNKYPITDIHEVFIHSPSDTDDIEHLPLDQVSRILTAYRDRYRAHENDGQVLIFCNHGFHAGASLKHPHAQLVVVPKQINLDSLYREPIANIVEEDTFFVTYCPDFSQWPYETWIAPKQEGTRFGDMKDDELTDLAGIMQRVLRKMEKIYITSTIKPKDRSDNTFVYNYYIYHGVNWFIRIIPRFIHRAGFELGTGLNVNVVDPPEAVKELQEMHIP
jgi:UDPglucose--hexose-1-phosphate uridylyltransferase